MIEEEPEQPEETGTEVAAANPTATESSQAGDNTSNDGDSAVDGEDNGRNNLIIGAVVLGLGVGIGLLIAGVVVMMRRS